jgi:sugar phosphate isomerase/epimerase
LKKNQISIQLYTLREDAAADFGATLAKVAEVGYTAVEFAGFHGHDPREIRNLLNANGLRASSAHIPIDAFRDDFEKTAEDLVTIGADWGIVPWVAPEDRNEEYLKSLAEEFNSIAERLKPAGIKFGYHNHDFEFELKTSSGQTLFDAMVELSDPETVHFELDAFWAAVGGSDPAEVIKQHGKRIALVHLKDGKLIPGTRGEDSPFGKGDLKWEGEGGILEVAREVGVSWYVTEQDNPQDVYSDIAISLQNAQRLAL